MAVDSLAGDLQDELVFQTCVTTREIQEVTSSTHSGVERIQVAILKLQDLLSENMIIQEPKDEHLRKSTLTELRGKPQFLFQQKSDMVIKSSGLAPSAQQPDPFKNYTRRI